ncbi:hypothetical protein [Demequina activiva]|uniref:Uncharacterized protein n=1 Tax=Demequina activiva TaxID=1582364 RepID=A0A919UIY5_9MICO|nr:hypothetical protein [Demequina activiva]GIG53831.1 hypothetical protein Dac01nite_05830 [Demequina activiva]
MTGWRARWRRRDTGVDEPPQESRDQARSTSEPSLDPDASHRVILLASRSDGVGGRLAALLNGMRLARLLGVPLRLIWPADHGLGFGMTIPPAEQVFSPRFLAEHADAPHDGRRTRRLPAEEVSLKDLRSRLDAREAWAMPLALLDTWVTDREAAGPFRREFDEVEFAPAFATAVAAADAIDVEPTWSALHVRGGDIVFGRNRRHFIHTRKAVPYPVVDALAQQLRAEGLTPLLFGQERDVLETLARRHGGQVALDLLPGELQGLPLALAEMVLMSRMPRIVASDSVFARMATALSGTPLTRPEDLLPPDEQAAVCDRVDPDAWPPLAVAYAHFYGYYVTRDTASPHASLPRIEAAAAADPDNPLYPIVQASLLERLGRDVDAEAVLARAHAATYPEDMGDLESTLALRFGTWRLLEEFVAPIERLAERGSPTAATLTARLADS